MLLDEPFAGIDPLAIADIREVIGYLKGRGIGILITDHNVRETLDIIDRASIIHAGEVLFEGSPARDRSTIRKCAASIWATASRARARPRGGLSEFNTLSAAPAGVYSRAGASRILMGWHERS